MLREAELGGGGPGTWGSRAGLHLWPALLALSSGGVPQGAAPPAAVETKQPFSGEGRQVPELGQGTLDCPAGWEGCLRRHEAVEQLQ